MALVHLIEVDQATGAILGEWKNDPSRIGLPIAKSGRTFIDVTHLQKELGDLSIAGARVEAGVVVEPPPRAPVIDLRAFFRLFTMEERLAIAAARETDPTIADFWLLLSLGQTIDLGHADTAAGLSLLVAKEFITEQRKAEVLANRAPERK